LKRCRRQNPPILGLDADKGDALSPEERLPRGEALIPAILSENPRTKLTYHHAAYDIACIYALEGKSSEAVKWLREAAATGFPSYPLFERDAYLNRIRQAPNFVRLLTKMRTQFEKYEHEFTQ
jgi:hypothetical protein